MAPVDEVTESQAAERTRQRRRGRTDNTGDPDQQFAPSNLAAAV